MKKQPLTKETAYKELQDFFNNKPFVLFATGTSCAVDFDFGMGALENHLRNEMSMAVLSKEQAKEWNNVIELLTINPDFEAAMNSIQDNGLLNMVIEKTAEHVSNTDRKNELYS